MCNTRSNIFIQSMKTNPISVKKLMRSCTTIVRGVWNHHSYTVGHATNKSWKSSNLSFSSFCKFFKFSNSSTLQFLQHFRLVFFIAYIYIYNSYSSPTSIITSMHRDFTFHKFCLILDIKRERKKTYNRRKKYFMLRKITNVKT